MVTINVEQTAGMAPLQLGQEQENNFAPRAVSIDWTAWREIYPEGTLSVIVGRPDGESYPAVTGITDCPYTWTPSETDTAVAGAGLLEIRIDAAGAVGKTITIPTFVRTSLTAGPAPDPAPSWYTETQEARDEAVAAAGQAEAAVAHYPYIDADTGTWWAWDATNEVMIDTEIPATGPQGETGNVGPTGATGPAGPTVLYGMASGASVSFADGADAPVRALSVQICATQSGSGTPAPDNERPISGRSAVTLSYLIANTFRAESFNYTTGEDNASTQRIRTDYVPAIPSSTVRVSFSRGVGDLAYCFHDTEGAVIAGANIANISAAGYRDISIPANAAAIKVRIGSSVRPVTLDNNADFAVSQLVSIPFGQTVYGGTLNVPTGVLTIMHAEYDLAALSWAKTGDNTRWRSTDLAGTILGPAADDVPDALAESYPVLSYSALGQSASSPVGIAIGTTGNLFARSSVGVPGASPTGKVVLPLLSALTVQLTPTEVRTLLGTNTLSADTGDVQVEYCAHPAEPTAPGTYSLRCTVTASGRSFGWEAD